MSDRRVYVLFCLGWFLALGYRDALLNQSFDSSGWLAFVAIWLPAAILVGLLVTFIVPRFSRSARVAQTTTRTASNPRSWILPGIFAIAAGVLLAAGHPIGGAILAVLAFLVRWGRLYGAS